MLAARRNSDVISKPARVTRQFTCAVGKRLSALKKITIATELFAPPINMFPGPTVALASAPRILANEAASRKPRHRRKTLSIAEWSAP
jgi:hypothetical protein